MTRGAPGEIYGGGYLIYAIERARGGYLNNAIRILFQRSINAFRPYRAVRFCPGKSRKRRGRWELDGRGIDEGGYLGDRSIRRVRRTRGGELDTRKVTRYHFVRLVRRK